MADAGASGWTHPDLLLGSRNVRSDLGRRSDGWNWTRRAAGYGWLAAWMAVLWIFVDPWRNLGGLESEWLRWLEGWALATGLILGGLIGRFARDSASGIVGRTHATLLRYVLFPPAAIAAIALVALRVSEESGPIGVVVTAFLAYWAGLDITFGALPMMEGKDYAFGRPLVPDADPEDVPGGAWLPPWERP